MQRELSERSQACLREGGAEAVCYKFEEYHLHRAGISPSVLSCTDQEREQRTWLDLQLWLKEEGERVRELWIQAGGGWSSAQDFSLCGNRKAKCKEMKKKGRCPDLRLLRSSLWEKKWKRQWSVVVIQSWSVIGFLDVKWRTAMILSLIKSYANLKFKD